MPSGFSILHLLHGYEDVIATITQLALQQVKTLPGEFLTLDLCLDDAIAEALTVHAAYLGDAFNENRLETESHFASPDRALRGPLFGWARALTVFTRHFACDSCEERARESALRLIAELDPIAKLIDETPGTRRTRVLIIEDDDDVRNGLAELCDVLGHDVLVAYDGVTGVATALGQLPDIAFIDIGLPDFDGCEVARRIHADVRGAHVLLVALTGYSSAHQRTLAMAAGFHLYIVKPTDIADIATTIAAVRPVR